MRNHLTTFDDVIRKLGGVPAVAKMTNRVNSAVWNWRNRGGVFPAVLHQPMIDALAELDPPYTAEPRLWQQEQLVKIKQRNAA